MLNNESTDLPDVEWVQDIVESVLDAAWVRSKSPRPIFCIAKKDPKPGATKNVVVEVGKTMDEYLQKRAIGE
jgi:hypothetical protein